MWVATTFLANNLLDGAISTHTTHVGGDGYARYLCHLDNPISTHTTHVGGDLAFILKKILWRLFQLTPPMWVATSFLIYIVQHYRHFNSHHPCGWRHLMTVSNLRRKRFQLTPPMRAATFVPDSCFKLIGISTHATHEGGDHYDVNSLYPYVIFQLTPPMRAATRKTS